MPRLEILDSTKKQLFAACRGVCTICKTKLFRMVGEQPLQIGEIAHICGYSVTGPRHDPAKDDETCRGFDNLMVLCPSCHVEIDAVPDHYTVDRLRQLKAAHEAEDEPDHGSDAAALQLREHPPVTMVLVFSAEGSSRRYAAKRHYQGPTPILDPGTPYHFDELDKDFIVRTPRVTETGTELWSETLTLPDADTFPDIDLRERLRAAGWEILEGYAINDPE